MYRNLTGDDGEAVGRIQQRRGGVKVEILCEPSEGAEVAILDRHVRGGDVLYATAVMSGDRVIA